MPALSYQLIILLKLRRELLLTLTHYYECAIMKFMHFSEMFNQLAEEFFNDIC